MLIGILSDTHDDDAMTKQALQELRRRGVQTLFHCGDLTSPELVQHFDGFETFFVGGNMDRRQVPALKASVAAQSNARWLGKGSEIELDGRRIAITHGDREDILEKLLFAEPDYLFTGHTHRRRDERVGSTRVINPGALGGVQHETRSIGILNLVNDQLETLHLAP